MLTAPAVAFFEVVLAIHIMAVIVTFGVTFAYPIMFSVGARASCPLSSSLHTEMMLLIAGTPCGSCSVMSPQPLRSRD